LRFACKLAAWLSVGQTGKKIHDDLHVWYETTGKDIVRFSRTATDADDDAEDEDCSGMLVTSCAYGIPRQRSNTSPFPTHFKLGVVLLVSVRLAVPAQDPDDDLSDDELKDETLNKMHKDPKFKPSLDVFDPVPESDSFVGEHSVASIAELAQDPVGICWDMLLPQNTKHGVS